MLDAYPAVGIIIQCPALFYEKALNILNFFLILAAGYASNGLDPFKLASIRYTCKIFIKILKFREKGSYEIDSTKLQCGNIKKENVGETSHKIAFVKFKVGIGFFRDKNRLIMCIKGAVQRLAKYIEFAAQGLANGPRNKFYLN